MKDQKRLLHKCLNDEIPVFVLCGTDALAAVVLEKYAELAKTRCSGEFCEDLRLLIKDFRQFQLEEPEKIKIPD